MWGYPLSDLSSSHALAAAVHLSTWQVVQHAKDLACCTTQACMPSNIHSMDSSSKDMCFKNGRCSCVVYQAGVLGALARESDVHHWMSSAVQCSAAQTSMTPIAKVHGHLARTRDRAPTQSSTSLLSSSSQA